MRILITFVFLYLITLSNSVKAQDNLNKATTNEKSSFYGGLYVAPTYLPTPPPYRYYAYIFPGESKSIFVTGLQVGYLYKNFISAQVGFEKGNVKYYSDKVRIYTFGAPDLSNPDNYFKSEYDVNIYQFPVLIKTYLSNKSKKLRFYLPLGIVYRKQIADEILKEYSTEEKIINEYKSTLTDQFWSLNIAGGIQYPLFHRILLFAEPT